MRRKPLFTKKEIQDVGDRFFKNWAHLEDLHRDLENVNNSIVGVIHGLQEIRDVLESKLDSIAIMLGGPKR